jgi:hypothetical protein
MESGAMVGVLVKFSYERDFNEEAVRAIAESARSKFEGMPELRLKAFTYDIENREAMNFYVWQSEEAARGFFTAERLESITDLYGVTPKIQYVRIATLVENSCI